MYLSGEVRSKRTSDDGKMTFLSVLETDEIVNAYGFSDAPGLDVVNVGDRVEATVRLKAKTDEGGGNARVTVQVRQVVVTKLAGELAAVS